MRLAIVTNGKSGLYSGKNEMQLVDLDTGERVPFVSNLKWEIDAELNVPLITLEMRCIDIVIADDPNQYAMDLADKKREMTRDTAKEDVHDIADALNAWHKDFIERSEQGLEELELDEETTKETESVDRMENFKRWLRRKR